MITLPSAMLFAPSVLRSAEEPGFVLDIVTACGTHLRVNVTFLGADELHVAAR